MSSSSIANSIRCSSFTRHMHFEQYIIHKDSPLPLKMMCRRQHRCTCNITTTIADPQFTATATISSCGVGCCGLAVDHYLATCHGAVQTRSHDSLDGLRVFPSVLCLQSQKHDGAVR